MARGGDDSDEERHDRFRSERSNTAGAPASSALATSRRYDVNSRTHDRRYAERKSRERDRSRSRRSRERSSTRNRRNESDSDYHHRRSGSNDKGRREKEKSVKDSKSSHRERSGSKQKHSSSRDKRFSDGKSDSQSSHESHRERKKHKHSKQRRDRENRKSEPGVDTFMQKFERRRDSSVEEVVDDSVIFRDSSSSPDRYHRKIRRNGEKDSKKEKRKEKKKKRSGEMDTERSFLKSPSVSTLLRKEDEISDHDVTLRNSNAETRETINDPAVYGPRRPEALTESEIESAVPSAVPQDSLPGNRPSLPAQQEKGFYGPVVPPSLQKKTGVEEVAETTVSELLAEKKDDAPPATSNRVYGPALPERAPVPEVTSDLSYGPALPPGLAQAPKVSDSSESDEDFSYGPQPVGAGGRTQEELEIRAALIKRQLENQDTSAPQKRDKWMTELPDEKRAIFGLGPRKFKKRDGPDMSDRSSWTDTPEEKNKKLMSAADSIDDDDDQLDSKRLGIVERDKEMEKKARQGKKRDKSLMEIHQKALKKKKKKEKKEKEGEPERRPFNREIDLQTNRFDEAQKRSIIKKAQLLDSRFSSGESKYL